MSTARPDYQDADLVFRLYDLRRETVMRESRDLLMRDFWPKSYEEFKAIANDITLPVNRAFRQVTSYWEMAFGLARHGIVNADYLAESCGEGIFVFAKIAPFLEQFRADSSPTAFQNVEWIIKNSKVAEQRFELVKKRVQSMLEQRRVSGQR